MHYESGHRHKILAAFLSMRKWFGVVISYNKPKTGYYSAYMSFSTQYQYHEVEGNLQGILSPYHHLLLPVHLTTAATMCFETPDCSGQLHTVKPSPKQCCVETDEAAFYMDTEGNCKRCIGK